MVVVRGRLEPEAGALLMQALEAGREALYQKARISDPATAARDVSAETSSYAQKQADALALLAETALHHGLDPGTSGERYPRFRGNVSAPGVRRQPRSHASRRPGPRAGGGRAHPDDPACPTARAPASGQRLPLPGLRRAVRTGSSHPTLGSRRPDDIVESGAAVSPSPSCGARGRLQRRAITRRGAPVPMARKSTLRKAFN
jgi:hypothetical protein